MTNPTWWCPHDHGPLVRSEANGVHETCDSCHGFAVTIWLLGEMLIEGEAGEIWRTAAEAAARGDRCPSCRDRMRPVALSGAAAGEAGVEVCQECELVWIDHRAVPLLPVRPELAVAAGVASLDRRTVRHVGP